MRGNKILQRIGLVLHVSPSRKIVLKAENVPRIGDAVVDEKLKVVGTVFDVFGPTPAPYVSVKPKIGEPHHLINHILYANPSKPGRKKNGKKGKR